ncbi:MAG: hypothetical protein IKD46_09980 [Lentisphaeria bacterium]|nr:hypothetical protein [Lentisphaeria bacterium]
MDELKDTAEADLYFANHPQGARWREELDDDARSGALRVAELDILCTLGTKRVPDRPDVRAAWFEQALYLISHPAPPDDGSLQSESIEGVGSRTYTGRKRFLAPRTEQLLVPYLRSLALELLRG